MATPGAPPIVDGLPGYVPGSDPFLDWYHGVAPPAPVDAAPAVAPAPAVAAPPVEPQPTAPVADPALLATPVATPSAPPGAPPVPPLPAPPLAQAPMVPMAPPPVAPPVTDEIAGAPGAPPPAPPPLEAPALPPPGHRLEDYNDPALAQQMTNLALRDPAEFAVRQAEHNQARDRYVEARRNEALSRDYDQQIANVRMRQEAERQTLAKLADVEASAQKLAETKVDPTGGMSTGQKIAGVLAAIMGGLVQGRTGAARNAGLDALNETIERGIKTQMAELSAQERGIASKRSALHYELARHGDAFQAAETVRLAGLKHAEQLLLTAQQDFDPRGTAAMQHAALIQQVRAQQQTVASQFAQKNFENSLKLQQAAREQQIADETARRNRETALHERQQIGLGYAQLANQADERKLAREQRADDKAAERADKEAERDRQFAIGGTPHLEVGPDGKPVMGPDGKPKVSLDDLRNADGSRWRAASPEEAGKLREKKTAATQLVKLYDRALALRDRVGGESSVGNSDEYQELKAIEKEIILLRKQGTQGMSSDADMENLAEAGGAKDLTSFRAKSAGLLAARARIEDKLNQEFRDARYTGPALTFPAPTTAKNTAEEDRNQRLIEKGRETFDDVVAREIEKRTGGRPLDMNNPDDVRASQEAFAAARAGYDSDASVQQREDLSALGRKALAGGADAPAARAVLESVAKGAHTSRMRELAQAELDALDAGKKPTPRGPSSRAVVIPDALRLPEVK